MSYLVLMKIQPNLVLEAPYPHKAERETKLSEEALIWQSIKFEAQVQHSQKQT